MKRASVEQRGLAAEIEANLAHHFSLFGSLPGSVGSITRDRTWVATRVSHPVPNGVFRFEVSPSHTDIAIDEILSEFDSRAIPFRWIVGPSARPADLGDRLQARGLCHTRDWIGMAADLEPARAFDRRSEAAIAEVESVGNFADYLRVLGDGFGFPDELIDLFGATFGQRTLGPSEPLRHFVAYVDGRPAATTTIHAVEGVAGIYWVATVPWARRRGIGTDLVDYVLCAAALAGARLAVLHSTAMGLGPYRRAGFRDVCLLALYEPADKQARARPSGGHGGVGKVMKSRRTRGGDE